MLKDELISFEQIRQISSLAETLEKLSKTYISRILSFDVGGKTLLAKIDDGRKVTGKKAHHQTISPQQANSITDAGSFAGLLAKIANFAHGTRVIKKAAVWRQTHASRGVVRKILAPKVGPARNFALTIEEEEGEQQRDRRHGGSQSVSRSTGHTMAPTHSRNKTPHSGVAEMRRSPPPPGRH